MALIKARCLEFEATRIRAVRGLRQTEEQRVTALAKQWALVTGASGGIGAAIAEALARAGVNTIIVGRDRCETRRSCTQAAERLSDRNGDYLRSDKGRGHR